MKIRLNKAKGKLNEVQAHVKKKEKEYEHTERVLDDYIH